MSDPKREMAGVLAVVGLTLVILGFLFGIGGLLWLVISPDWAPLRFTIACAAMLVVGLVFCASVKRLIKDP